MRLIATCAVLLFALKGASQFSSNCDTVGQHSKAAVYNFKLGSDSLSSAFCIVIRTEVKPHLHKFHSEQVIVLSGEAKMRLGNNTFNIKKGDVIFIPKNTVHAVTVTGSEPLKVISVQSPRFDGTDRVSSEY